MTAKRNKYTTVKRPIATCRDEVRLIADYLTNNLSFSERAAFEAHLTACPDCGAFLTTYKKTIELTRSFLHAHIRRQYMPHLQLH
jgi:anti-sigma factor RsiW